MRTVEKKDQPANVMLYTTVDRQSTAVKMNIPSLDYVPLTTDMKKTSENISREHS